jgi:hypothetical protein
MLTNNLLLLTNTDEDMMMMLITIHYGMVVSPKHTDEEGGAPSPRGAFADAYLWCKGSLLGQGGVQGALGLLIREGGVFWLCLHDCLMLGFAMI